MGDVTDSDSAEIAPSAWDLLALLLGDSFRILSPYLSIVAILPSYRSLLKSDLFYSLSLDLKGKEFISIETDIE